MPTRCNRGFIADLIACSTCFGHHYAHHQELKSIIFFYLFTVFIHSATNVTMDITFTSYITFLTYEHYKQYILIIYKYNNNNIYWLSIYHLQVQYHRFGSCHIKYNITLVTLLANSF